MWKLALIGKRKRITKIRIYKILHPLRRNGYEEGGERGRGASLPASGCWNLSPAEFMSYLLSGS